MIIVLTVMCSTTMSSESKQSKLLDPYYSPPRTHGSKLLNQGSSTPLGPAFPDAIRSAIQAFQAFHDPINFKDMLVVYQPGTAVKMDLSEEQMSEYIKDDWTKKSFQERVLDLETKGRDVPKEWHHQQFPYALVNYVLNHATKKVHLKQFF